MKHLILASRSPRRSLLLNSAGYSHTVRVAEVDESPIKGEQTTETVLRLSHLKADSVARSTGEAVLGADTLVVLDGVALGKPRDLVDAEQMLSTLSGRTHSVLTGWTILSEREELFGVSESRITFRELTTEEILSYVTELQPLDKAGAYALQGDNGRLISNVSGSRANVMGLPLREVAEALNELGITRSTSQR